MKDLVTTWLSPSSSSSPPRPSPLILDDDRFDILSSARSLTFFSIRQDDWFEKPRTARQAGQC